MSLRSHAAVTAACVVTLVAGSAAAQRSGWMQSFAVNVHDLVTDGENSYFILKPGYQLTLEGAGRNPDRLVITVLRETATIGGVETRVVEERETSKGRLAEVSRNFYAIDRRTHDVYYFGEDSATYKNGVVVNREGSWRHGVQAQFGLMMPGSPMPGLRFYQELAPTIAMDRAEILSVNATVTTPAGTFDRCVTVRETTPLERFARETKVYAPGIGVIRDGSLSLVSHAYVP